MLVINISQRIFANQVHNLRKHTLLKANKVAYPSAKKLEQIPVRSNVNPNCIFHFPLNKLSYYYLFFSKVKHNFSVINF